MVKTPMFIGTICAANHLPRAACLASSLHETQSKHTFVLCLVERDASAISNGDFSFSKVVLASELGIPSFEAFIFRHSVGEACCAIKAQFLLWALRNFPNEHAFLFLEPDIVAYSRFEELELLLEGNSHWAMAPIVVTPYHLEGESSWKGAESNDLRVLITGSFNSGFLGVRRSSTAADFLLWWNHKLQAFCYMEWRTRGLFVDQKWLALGISLFDMTILREPGYNVANWDILGRTITEESGQYLVNKKMLRFFHFADMEFDRDLYLFRTLLDKSSPVFSMRRKYQARLDRLGQRVFSRMPWSYGSFASGASISPESRLLYRNTPQLEHVLPNPFAQDNSQSVYDAVFAQPTRGATS